jgi:hypothetical protein
MKPVVAILVIVSMFCMMSSAAAAFAAFIWWEDIESLWKSKEVPSPVIAEPSVGTVVAPSIAVAPSIVAPSVAPSIAVAPSTVAPSAAVAPGKSVTNPGDFSLASIDYKPVGNFKADVLGIINNLRSIRNASDPKPKTPIVPLTWDPELEAGACIHADINAKSTMHHPGVSNNGWEVIAWHDPATHGGIFAWWNEHKLRPNAAYPHVPTAWHCDPGNTGCSDTGHEGGDLATGHYAYLSHSNATRIGCCTSTAGTWAPLVCQGK